MDRIFDFFSRIASLDFRIVDVFDILIVTFVIYNAIKLIRETRAVQLLKGLILLFICYFVVYTFNMQASSYLFMFIFKNLFLLLVIVFQQEIRQILEKFGKNGFKGILNIKRTNDDNENKIRNSIFEISKAIQRMSNSKTGSLIVMENEVLLGDIVDTGITLDAEITHELIGNIFFPNTPLHDGAAIVRKGKLLAAGCVLPLTKRNDVSSELGTRHRAAIGVSEVCDAIVVITSEETGQISIAKNGTIKRDISDSELREILLDYFIPKKDDDSNSIKSKVTKVLKKHE